MESVTISDVSTSDRCVLQSLLIRSWARGEATIDELAELLGVPAGQVRRRLRAPAQPRVHW